MLVSVALLVGSLVPVAWAATATIFPVGLGPDAGLQGEIVGTGGEVGTTYVLSGETSGIPFTLTLAEDASLIAETVAIPTLSFNLAIGCVVSAGSAVCENVVGTGAAATSLPLTTFAFSPFAVAVSSGAIAASTTPASASATSTVATTSTSVLTSATTAPSASPSSTTTILSSVAPSQSTIAPSSARSSTTALSPSTSTASLASPSASQSSTSDGFRVFVANVALMLPLAAGLWVLA